MIPYAVGGIDRDGTGAVYSFDPVGSYERESCRAAGAAQELVQPFLDALVGGGGFLVFCCAEGERETDSVVLSSLARHPISTIPFLRLVFVTSSTLGFPPPTFSLCVSIPTTPPPRRLCIQVNGKNQVPAPGETALKAGERSNLPLERVLGLVTDAFTGATEREIYVGDMMELVVVQVKRDDQGRVEKVEMGTVRKELKRD